MNFHEILTGNLCRICVSYAYVDININVLLKNMVSFTREMMTSLNPHLKSMESDILYHIAMATDTHDLPKMFGDIKFVLVGGTPSRMKRVAQMMQAAIDQPDDTPQNFANGTDRYAVYKAGPVLSVSHGIGFPSVAVMLHEIIKLLHHAKCQDVKIIRLGTSGGIGVEPGTVVITTEAVNGILENYIEIPILGKMVRRYSIMDKELVEDIIGFCQKSEKCNFPIVAGKTMSVPDFYESQGRLDGAFCEYSESDKMAFLNRLEEHNVKNIEMESLALSAMCHKAGIGCAVICAALLNRLHGDQMTASKEDMRDWDGRPLTLIIEYIKYKLMA